MQNRTAPKADLQMRSVPLAASRIQSHGGDRRAAWAATAAATAAEDKQGVGVLAAVGRGSRGGGDGEWRGQGRAAAAVAEEGRGIGGHAGRRAHLLLVLSSRTRNSDDSTGTVQAERQRQPPCLVLYLGRGYAPSLPLAATALERRGREPAGGNHFSLLHPLDRQ